MKNLTAKILTCAAALALVTVTDAQSTDTGQQGAAPDNGGQTVNQNGQAPNIIVVPVPSEVMMDSNGAPVIAPAQVDSSGQGTLQLDTGNQLAPPSQPAAPGMNPSQGRFQGQGRGFDRQQRRFDRQNGRNPSQPQPLSANSNNTSAYTPPAQDATNGTEQLYVNFRNAPIDEVLNYLSDAAGFIIELDTQVRGTVDVWSTHPVTRDEAVQLLNSVLNRNGYDVVREGRILRVMNHSDAIHSAIPVEVSSDPAEIPKTAEIVTQIIPVRYVQARQLVTDLSPLISPQATILANESANSIVVTDTQENIHHLVEIIKAIDTSAEDVTELRVFHLQYHDPAEVANMLTSVFAGQNGQNNSQGALPIRFGGFGGGGFRRFFGGGGGFGGGPGGGGGGAGGNGNNQNDRLRQHATVTAVADPRTQSVLVTAPKDMMDEIQELITQIDQESPKVAQVSVVHLENADPQQVQKALQDFQASNTRGGQGSQQNSVLMQRELQNNTSGSSGFGTGSGMGGFGGGGFGGGGGYGGGGFGGVGGGFRGGGQ